MEFASASGFAHSTFYTFTPRFRYFRAWWGWWLKSKGAIVRIERPSPRVKVRSSDTFARFLLAGTRGEVVAVENVGLALSYIAGGKRFPKVDVDAIRARYPVTSWRVSGDVLFAFVGTVPVGLVTSIWIDDKPMPRGHCAKVAT